jgi:hypothetical protein
MKVRSLTARRLALGLVPFVVWAWSVAAGCGGDDDPGSGGASSEGTSSGGEGGTFSSGSSTGGFDACATATLEGERTPVQLLIMFDKSGSMLDDQKWAGAKAALIAFFQDDDTAGLNIALRFFPDDDPVAGCNEVACNVDACAAPLVALGELNAQPAFAYPQPEALVLAVESKTPGGQTPMFAALAGAEQWAVATASPDFRTAVVLVTDGKPNGCSEDINAIAQLAADALASDEISTHIIGMNGADIAQLNQIAMAGGTNSAFVIGNGSVHSDLVAAFEAIGTEPLNCVLPVPEASTLGTDVNPGEVNLSYTPKDGDAETIPQVMSAGDCAGGEGWYYDNPMMPTTMTLCPTTCDIVQADPGAQLDVVLGCATVIK